MIYSHVFIKKTDYFNSSEELLLAYNFLVSAFSELENSQIHFLDEGSFETNNDDLQIMSILSQVESTALVFFVKNSALLIDKQVIDKIISLLKNNNNKCIVPASHLNDKMANEDQYYTLLGYENHVKKIIFHSQKEFKSFDNREVDFFATSVFFLKKNKVSQDYFSLPHQYPKQTSIALNTYMHSFSNYFKMSNMTILKHIPSTATSLLDIGCSSGIFGQQVKEKYNIRVEGIEINQHAAELAAKKIDCIYHDDVFQVIPSTTFDCVTCLDVLEHFTNPDLLLQHISKNLLNHDGRLLLSIPNVGFWPIIDDLIAGRWDYVPSGILCNTHLRFFTKKTIIDMLKRNNYTVETIHSDKVALPVSIQNQFLKLEKLGKHIDWESLQTINFNVIAQKSELTN